MAALSNFWQRIITGSVFLIVMIGAIILSFETFLILFGLVTVLASVEYSKLTSTFAESSKWSLLIINIVCYLLIALAMLDIGNMVGNNPVSKMLNHFFIARLFSFIIFLFPVILFIIEIIRNKSNAFSNAAYNILGFIYIGMPFTLLILSGNQGVSGYQYQLILAFFISIWVTDSFAYVWGKLIGKHKLAPNISAGKTMEGTIGGIITTMGVSFLFPVLFPAIGYSTIQWIIFSGLTALFSVPSDLSESLLKRRAGVKDSGNILPGHGGILDRFDSVLLTAPVIFVYSNIIKHI